MSAISIIANVYNEADNLGPFLAMLCKQRFADFELIVVDDGSTDGSLDLLKSYRERLQIRTCRLPHVGLKKARAAGIQMVDSPLFAVIDVDILIDADCIAKFVSAFDAADVGAVAGRVLTAGTSWLARGSGVVAAGSYSALSRADGTKDLASGGFSAYRLSAVEAVGGFAQEKVAADLEISWRLQANGWKIIGREDIVGYHKDPDTLRGIYRWGYTRGQMGFYTRLGYKRKLLHWAQLVRFAPMFLAALAIWRWRLAVLALLSSLLVFLLYVRKQPASLVDKIIGWFVLMTKMSGWNLGFVREALLHLKKRVVD